MSRFGGFLMDVAETVINFGEQINSPVLDEEEDLLEMILSQKVMQERQERLQLRAAQKLQKFFEGNQGKKARLLYRFRALAHLVLMARHLVPKSYVIPEGVEEVTTGLPHFDLNAYKRSKINYHLPYQVKCILIRPTWFRSNEEIELVDKTLSNLPFFQKYPRATQRAMAKVLNYQYVDSHRVVLRQGHMPLFLYFVLSGTLVVQIEEKDAETGAMIVRQVNKMRAGSVFGDLALIHNTPRTSTVITKYPCEFLLLDKDDYDILLKESIQHQWTGCYNALTSLRPFDRWSHEDLQDCSRQAKLVQFKNNEIILGNVDDNHLDGNLYFVVDGKCRLVEMLCFMTQKGCDRALKIPIDITTDQFRPDPAQPPSRLRRFLQVSTINTGEYFGAGEDLRWRYVIAWEKVECLQIAHTYLRRRGHGTWLELLSDNLQSRLPTHKEIVQVYTGKVAWHTYKKHVMADLIKASRIGPTTQLTDVPLSIRQDEAISNWEKMLI